MFCFCNKEVTKLDINKINSQGSPLFSRILGKYTSMDEHIVKPIDENNGIVLDSNGVFYIYFERGSCTYSKYFGRWALKDSTLIVSQEKRSDSSCDDNNIPNKVYSISESEQPILLNFNIIKLTKGELVLCSPKGFFGNRDCIKYRKRPIYK